MGGLRYQMTITAARIVDEALKLCGTPYVFGAEAVVGEAPDALDCSELVQFICETLALSPRMPDGSWRQYQHCAKHDALLSVASAMRVRGALLFRFDGDPTGQKRPRAAHVAISLGDGRTVEAKSTRDGTGVFTAAGRGWTHAGLIPGVGYV